MSVTVITVDNLQLLLLSEVDWWQPAIWLMAAKYCAKKMMDHIGYDAGSLPMYITGAMLVNNKETIKHLSTKIGVNLPVQLAGCMLYIDFADARFVQWLIQENYYQPREEDWNLLKIRQPELYQGLQADV